MPFLEACQEATSAPHEWVEFPFRTPNQWPMDIRCHLDHTEVEPSSNIIPLMREASGEALTNPGGSRLVPEKGPSNQIPHRGDEPTRHRFLSRDYPRTKSSATSGNGT